MTLNKSHGPLEGLRVVEIAGIGPAPFCAMLLADLGAEVLRVDRPGATRDPARANILNRGRQSVQLDLKSPRGAEVVLQLAAKADVLLEGFRPGVAERLGIGPAHCRQRNPALVYARMTGWGQQGPLAETAGHDINYIALTGALHSIGRAGGPPQVPVNLVGDFGGGAMLMAFGICAALWERHRSGLGQVVDAAIVDGTAALMALSYTFLAAGSLRPERGVNRLDTGAPFYDVYETADGEWMAVGALEPQFYAVFVELLGLGDLPNRDLPDRADPANYPALRALFSARFRERTREEWAEVFRGSDACVAPVLSVTEAPDHPHIAARRTYVNRDGLVQPGPAPRFDRTPAALGPPAAVAGEHTREALTAWGVTDVEGLLADGTALAAPTAAATATATAGNETDNDGRGSAAGRIGVGGGRASTDLR